MSAAARLGRIRGALDRSQRRSLAMMASVIVALHAIGFFLLFTVVVPHHYSLGSGGVFAIGTGVTAYTLGMRHAFDADHIAAIDNTTRKLMADRQRPLSVGFFFSLGHSTVVFLLSFVFAIGIRALSGQVVRSGSALHSVAGWVGAGVSGTFLYAIAAVNLVVLVGIVKVFRGMRSGRYDEAALERQLGSRGLMMRFLGRMTRTITRPWQMYPLGVLFGLGFDTATEVGLLFLAAGAAGAGLPFYAILCLPVLFAAGMSLLDTIDGAFMSFAYDWALARPVRKVFYNIALTGLSIAVALLIGTIELGGLLAAKLGARGAFWQWLEHVNINALGFIIVGMFALTWLIALCVWRFGRIEERWSGRLLGVEPVPQRESQTTPARAVTVP